MTPPPMSIPARHFTRILTTCLPHRQRRQRAAPRRVCGRPQSPRPPVSIPAQRAADVNLHATLHADPRARHAAGRSSRILATWQAKVPWKEILLLLAAAMSTLRHVEPRLRKRSSSSAPSAQTPRGTTRCAAPRDSTLHTARRRPSRSQPTIASKKKPDFRTLESSRGSARKPSRNPKIELYKTKNLSPLSDQLARMHIHAQSKFTHSTITTLPLCKSNVFVRRAANCN